MANQYRIKTMSIKEVADKTNLSLSTVYRVLEGNPAISETTSKRVRETMRQMGIVPAIPRRRSRIHNNMIKGEIAFVILGSQNVSANIQLVRGIEAELSDQDLKLIFTQASDFDALAEDIVRHGYSGVILHGWHVNSPSEASASKLRQIPTVWLMTHNEEWGDQVQPDNVAIGQMAARYLLSKGHTIAAYLMPEHPHLAFDIRGEAFCELFKRENKKCHMIFSDSRGNDKSENNVLNSMSELVGKLQNLPELPTGIFVPDDSYLPSLYNLFISHGIKPGLAVEVVSCGCKSEMLIGLTPKPISIDMDMERIGRKAVQQLFWRMQNPDDKVRVLIRVIPEGYDFQF